MIVQPGAPLLDLCVWWAGAGLVAALGTLGARLESSLPAAVWRLLGTTALSSAVWALLHLGLQVPRVAALEQWRGLPGAPWAIGAGLLAGAWAAGRAGRGHPRAGGRRGAAAWLAAAPLVLLPWCLLPPWAPDESLYHLGLPLHAWLSGSPWAPVGHGNGGFFALGDMLGAGALALGSVSAARGVQLGMVVLFTQAALALLPAALATRVLLAEALFVACPTVLWQLACAYVDVTQASYAVAGVLLLALAERGGRRARARLGAGCWLLGCAAACKLTGLGVAVGLALLAPARRPAAWALGPAARLALVLLPVLPFVLHNLWHYHDPIFPFGTPLWPGAEALAPSQHQALVDFMALHAPVRAGVPLRGWAAWLALPGTVLAGGAFASPALDGVLGALPALALLLASARCGARLLGLARRRHGGPLQAVQTHLLRLVALQSAVWLATSWQARFLLPAVLALGLWTTVGLPAWPRRARGRVLLAAALGAAMLACIPPMASLSGHWPPMSAEAWQGAARRQRLRYALVPGSRVCQHLPSPGEGRTMLVWSQRLLGFCLGDVASDSYDEAAALGQALGAAGGDGPRAARRLRAAGLTHLLVHEGLLASARAEGGSAGPLAAWPALRAKLFVVAAGGGHVLYALPAEP